MNRGMMAECEDILSVEGNGHGMASKDLQHVFDAFERDRSTRGGTGGGLALCRRVVDIDATDRSHCRVVVFLPSGSM